MFCGKVFFLNVVVSSKVILIWRQILSPYVIISSDLFSTELVFDHPNLSTVFRHVEFGELLSSQERDGVLACMTCGIVATRNPFSP